ncbi:hypothetical protein B0H19DRAFT_959240 [Mycena capillaripes]|nr:hypothetical protein B0H19DRAFT_959240 [Mycena capillaripes]
MTITQRELLSIAPDVRSQYKDVTTNRRIATEVQTPPAEGHYLNAIEETLPFTTETNIGFDLPPDALIASDEFATLYDVGVSPDAGELHVAADSCASRSVLPIVDNQRRIEAIYDTGSQIVGMSEAVANDLDLPYDPRITSMESANGTFSSSLGLARNVPFGFGDITLYLQCHIVRSPAYYIRLGRPFDQVAECKVSNSANGDQTLTIFDCNTGHFLALFSFIFLSFSLPSERKRNEKGEQKGLL